MAALCAAAYGTPSISADNRIRPIWRSQGSLEGDTKDAGIYGYDSEAESYYFVSIKDREEP